MFYQTNRELQNAGADSVITSKVFSADMEDDVLHFRSELIRWLWHWEKEVANRKEMLAEIEEKRRQEDQRKTLLYMHDKRRKNPVKLRLRCDDRPSIRRSSCCWPGHFPFHKKTARNQLHFTDRFVRSRKSSLWSLTTEDSLLQYHGITAWKWSKPYTNATRLDVNIQCCCWS